MNELLAFADRKSQPGNSWSGYATFLRYLDQAQRRLPALEELEHCDIDAVLTTELELLAVMLADIFLTEGFEELYSYLLTAQT